VKIITDIFYLEHHWGVKSETTTTTFASTLFLINKKLSSWKTIPVPVDSPA
jgi:hypothetical protein